MDRAYPHESGITEIDDDIEKPVEPAKTVIIKDEPGQDVKAEIIHVDKPAGPYKREDALLTPHFRLFELTDTDRAQFREENRALTDEQVLKLTHVAEMLEEVRAYFNKPIIVHSGYRCPGLNKAVGSTDRSQHLKCEAADFHVSGMDVSNAFMRLRFWNQLKYGQLIYESSKNRFGIVVEWLHISLGEPYREVTRCAQVLTMKDGKYAFV